MSYIPHLPLKCLRKEKTMVCKNCDRRYPGCHDNCEDYQQEKHERDVLNEKIRRERQSAMEVTAVEIDRGRRVANIRHRRGE